MHQLPCICSSTNFVIFINILDIWIHFLKIIRCLLCVSLIYISCNWRFIILRHFRKVTCICIQIFRHFSMITCLFILIFSYFRTITWVYIQISRSTTGSFRNYLRFDSLSVPLISNGIIFYGFIHCSKHFRSCFKIQTLFFNFFSGTTVAYNSLPT